MTRYDTIRYERRADVGVLTLARPVKRNAQNPTMWQELAHLGADLRADETLRRAELDAKVAKVHASV